MVRLARRGFTIGELGLVATGATAVFMEAVNLTRARIWPLTTPFVKTYRSPTPLLIYQIALIPGAFLTGFLLSPLLVLSRNLAQKPSHRLRYPNQKLPLRKALAAAFYGFAALIIGGLVGTWTGWCLGPDPLDTEEGRDAGPKKSRRNPWVWLLRYSLQGQRPWTRPALLTYWALVAIISVAGWSRQLARARKSGRKIVTVLVTGTPTSLGSANIASGGVLSVSGHDLRVKTNDGQTVAASKPNPANTVQSGGGFTTSSHTMSQSVTELLDAADKRVPTLSLNARRKFFHALAVVMFVPGIALDVSRCHHTYT